MFIFRIKTNKGCMMVDEDTARMLAKEAGVGEGLSDIFELEKVPGIKDVEEFYLLNTEEALDIFKGIKAIKKG